MADGLDDLSTEEQTAIRDVIERVDVDRIAEVTGVSRRQALQVIAATGVGIAVGGVGTNALVGQAKADASTSDGDGNVGLPSNRVDVFADGIDSNSVNAEEGQITGETVIKSQQTTDISGVSSATWTTFVDTEIDDNKDEQDSSFTITPAKTGEYNIEATAWFNSPADGDRLEIAIRDVDSGSEPTPNGRVRQVAPRTVTQPVPLSTTVELTAGANYEIQARNIDSSFTLRAFGGLSGYTITWEPVQP